MESQKVIWPVLGRGALLINRADAPQYAPHYCAEAAQLASMLAEFLQQESEGDGNDR